MGTLLRRNRFAALAIVATLSFGACREVELPPPGSYSEILVVTENGDTDEWYTKLRPFIERSHDYISGEEKAFVTEAVRALDLETVPQVKTIVYCGVLDTGTEIGQQISGLIGADGSARVGRGEVAILKKENVPTAGQMTLIITAGNAHVLDRVIAERGGQVESILEASSRTRLRRVLLRHPNDSVSRNLYRKYGFTLEVPYLYRLLSDEADPPGVELLREEPVRSLGVFWVDRKTQPSLWDYSELFDMRARYIWERYDHDKMERDRVRYEWVKFGRYGAIKMYGYWYNDNAVAGGYFETYFIWDEASRLVWAVDLLTFAPGRAKHPLVRELRALGETFRYH